MKRVFSGIQPTGNLHIGNYLGAMKQWLELQENKNYKNIFCIVDLHAITVPQEPKKLSEQIYSTMAMLLAIGLDPQKSILFVQSQISAHAELAWILNTLTYTGELERMTQFKEKSEIRNPKSETNHKSEIINHKFTFSPSVGLFDYPVLMAADILLYNTDLVPVGEDQKQHVELARDLAKRFNNRFGETFPVPQPLMKKEGCRIMGLDDPTKKMSKSATSEYNYIALIDNADTIRRKIAKAVTDSGQDVRFDSTRPGLSNLLTIYCLMKEAKPPSLEKGFEGKGYGEFKKALAELLIEKLAPIQKKYHQLIADKKYLDKIYFDGAIQAEEIAKKTLDKVKQKIGLLI